jgi:hypothetical protein
VNSFWFGSFASPEHAWRHAMHGPERTGKMALVGETCRNGGIGEAEPLFDQ